MKGSHLEVASVDVWNVNVVGGGADIFVFLIGEDIETDQMHFGVTVLARLGSTHFHNFAWATLDHNIAVLAESRALEWVGFGSTCAGGSVLFIAFHGSELQKGAK